MPTIGSAGIDLIKANTNPFRNGSTLKDVIPRFPDGKSSTVTMCATSEVAYDPSVYTSSGIIQLVPRIESGTYLPVGLISYGNDSLTIGQAPGGKIDIWAREQNIGAAILYTRRCRIIGGGIKVQYAGNLTTGSGTLRAGWTQYAAQNSGTPTFINYDEYIRGATGDVHQTRDGLTVSMPLPDDNRFKHSRAYTYTSWYEDDYFMGRMPYILFHGLSTGGIITVRFVIYYEVEVLPGLVPLQIGPSLTENNLDSIRAYVNSQERIVSGNSFAKVTWAAIRRAFNFAIANPQRVATAVGAGLRFAGSLV
jgi:hypothetical protein